MADQRAGAVVDVLTVQRQALAGGKSAAAIVEGLRGRGFQVATGDHVLPAVVDIRRGQHDIANLVAGIVDVDARFDDAEVVELAVASQRDIVARGDGVLIAESALGRRLDTAACIDRPLGVQALSLDLDGACRRGLRQAQMPIGIQLNIPTTGDHLAVQLHANPGLGTHQFDRAGVHTTQRRGVDGQLRFRTAIIGPGSGIQGIGINVITPSHDG
nr:hypothetical protein [Pseudomonas brassicacearum]